MSNRRGHLTAAGFFMGWTAGLFVGLYAGTSGRIGLVGLAVVVGIVVTLIWAEMS